MNYRNGFTILSLALIIFSCTVKPSEGVDEATGGYYKENGLQCDEIEIEINGVSDNRTEFIFGEEVKLMFRGVNGFKAKDGKIHPSIALDITDKGADSVVFELEESDLEFESNESIYMFADFIVGFPHKNDEQYEAKVQIEDQEGEGTFTYTLDFTIEASDLLGIKPTGLDYQQIYLWNQTVNVAALSDSVRRDEEHLVIFEGLTGFEEQDGKVFPQLSIELYNGRDSLMIEEVNALAEFAESGIDASQITGTQIYATLQFTEGRAVNPYRLVCRLSDGISEKEILVGADLILVEE